MRIIFSVLLFTVSQILCLAVYAGVRTVEVKDDQIIRVKTALGIATIIQVPDRPNSVVLGDQEAFRVEYLDKAITIKPLHSGAKSNLYIYTDWKRYNVELVNGQRDVADYVVYLKTPTVKVTQTSNIKWKPYQNFLKSGDIRLDIIRIGRASGLLFVEFKITSPLRRSLKPDWIWLTQNGVARPIHKLFLSSAVSDQRSPVTGIIQILESDLEKNSSFRVEFRKQGIKYLTLPKVISWG